jgi:hypothetical protein
MALKYEEVDDGKVLEVTVSKRLEHADYEYFVPETERLIRRHGNLNIVFTMHDFHGWEPRAMWDDLKFGIGHFGDLGRIAVVGEKRWQQWMTGFVKPFTMATIRYFPAAELEAARDWAREPD